MSRETEARQQDVITIKLDEPAPDIPEDVDVAILVVEDASLIPAWSNPYSINERIAFLNYVYSLIYARFSADARAVCESVATSRLYCKVLQRLVRTINRIEDGRHFSTLLVLNQLIDRLRTRLLMNIFTGCAITAEETQEELLAVAKVFEEWDKQAVGMPSRRKSGQEHELYFIRLDEIRADRLQHIENREELSKAINRANDLNLSDIEVGFFKDVLATSVVRGRHEPGKPHATAAPTKTYRLSDAVGA